jgi:hypothetical protein
MNSLNIKEDYSNKLKIASNEKDFQNIQDFMNNYQYKVSYVNIDSRFRNINPLNVVEMEPNYLPSNPLEISPGSFIVKLNVNENIYNVGDKIIIQNIQKNPIILNNCIYLINNYNYYMVNLDNHGIPTTGYKLDNVTKITYSVNVKSFEALDITDRVIGNIPINSILGLHDIYLYNNDETFLPNTIKNIIINELNITTEQLISNYFFIKLPFNYINVNQVGTTTVFTDFYNINKIFEFIFTNIGGIELQYLNSNYPINNQQYNPYQEIVSIGDKYIEFKITLDGTFYEKNGGDKVIIGKVINTIEGYPEANNYTIYLKKTFTDVFSLELVSSEYPFVYNNVNTKNKLYWKYLEDGEYIYSISINEGFYYADSLLLILKEKMNKIERVFSTIKDIVYTEFDITYNSDSEEFKFYAYKTNLLPYSLTLEQDLSLGSQVLKLIIKQSNNYVSVGDKITIENSSDIGDISSTLINTSHTIYSINREASTYTVILVTSLFLENTNLKGDGGAKITIRTPVFVSFLFNYNDTIGDLLGFKYVGQENSITKYNHITSNKDDYIIPTIYNSVGTISTSENYFNFRGLNNYILMYLNDYENLYTTNNFNNSFSKILMDGTPGDTLFNTFIGAPLVFDIPLKTLNELKISYLYPDGTSPDFRNKEHSFTLKIVERISRPTRTGLNSMKMNYLDAIKEFVFNLDNSIN